MEKSMNSVILAKVDNIIDSIQNSKEYQDYQFLFSKLSHNEQANQLITEVKSLQRKIVKKEVLKKSTDDLQKQLNSLLEQLNKIPLYVEFMEKQKMLNQIYQNIKQELDQYFYRILN